MLIKKSAALLFVATLWAAPPPARVTVQDGKSPLIVHEWGTFTSVAAPDGGPVHWRPLFGPVDLPEFVRRVGGCGYPKAGFALIRMETPVLYFYSKEPAEASVKVSFPEGLITEWYPSASKVNALRREIPLHQAQGAIEWDRVRIDPSAAPEFPREAAANHYYAARETDAAPVQVNGQWEKLLFYRGLAGFTPPVQAVLRSDQEVALNTVPTGLLFENRGGRAAVRKIDGPVLTLPEVRPDGAAEARKSLEEMLVSEGLYPKEARAMIETWRDSWFEDGMRLLYIVPEKFVNKVLPVTVQPAPAELRRVFVGRIELLPTWTA
ncbi:MAG: hypothetical protein FJW39_23885 [Acidobacteria bacterium]|nr:hypothetical protein [Acidobacteriota bacterium]